MIRRRRVLALTMLVSLLWFGVYNESTPLDMRTGMIWSYITDREFILMRGVHISFRVPNLFDEDLGPTTTVVWTRDGRYAAFLSDVDIRMEDPESKELIVVDSWQLNAKRYPCVSCVRLAQYSSDEIMATTSEGYYEFAMDDATSTFHKIAHPTSLKAASMALVGSTPSAAVFESLVGKNRLVITLNWIPTEQMSVMPALSGSSNDYLRFLELGRQAGTAQFALGYRDGPGECTGTFPVLQVNANQFFFHRRDIDARQLAPAGYVFGKDAGYEIEDLWADEDGIIHAIFDTWHCSDAGAESDRKQMVENGREAEVRHAVWTWSDTTGEPGERQSLLIAGSGRVMLVPQDCPARPYANPQASVCAGGHLILWSGTSRSKIAQNVLRIYAPRQ